MTRLFRWIEFIALFVMLPWLYVRDWLPVPMIPLLLCIAAVLFVALLRDKSFPRERLMNLAPLIAHGPGIVALFLASSATIGALVWQYAPDTLFNFVRQRPGMWLFVMVFYPVFSVYPQELIYRTWFFHRYRPILPRDQQLIWTSALAFGYMHIVFQNWIAVLLCVPGGYLFARTYARTHSTATVCFEHALYGCFIFTIGLGMYFYGGAVR
ncbi:MAG: CPBP family intramembrane metalloprotease [Candidatus Hydrogenedentes bacterium]|nr:CPBP family intramembrane metalloprotease [Candidatus Hydrogenedentota bacterium]